MNPLSTSPIISPPFLDSSGSPFSSTLPGFATLRTVNTLATSLSKQTLAGCSKDALRAASRLPARHAVALQSRSASSSTAPTTTTHAFNAFRCCTLTPPSVQNSCSPESPASPSSPSFDPVYASNQLNSRTASLECISSRFNWRDRGRPSIKGKEPQDGSKKRRHPRRIPPPHAALVKGERFYEEVQVYQDKYVVLSRLSIQNSLVSLGFYRCLKPSKLKTKQS